MLLTESLLYLLFQGFSLSFILSYYRTVGGKGGMALYIGHVRKFVEGHDPKLLQLCNHKAPPCDSISILVMCRV